MSVNDKKSIAAAAAAGPRLAARRSRILLCGLLGLPGCARGLLGLLECFREALLVLWVGELALEDIEELAELEPLVFVAIFPKRRVPLVRPDLEPLASVGRECMHRGTVVGHDAGPDLVDGVGQAGITDEGPDEWGLRSGRDYLSVSQLRSRGLADLGHVPSPLQFSSPKG